MSDLVRGHAGAASSSREALPVRIRTAGKIVSALALALTLAVPASAQTPGPGTGTSGVLLGAGVSFLRAEFIEDDVFETATGVTVDFRKNVASLPSVDMGVVGDFSWHRKSFTEEDFDEIFDFDLDTSFLSFMGGFRVTWSQLNRAAPFAQVLAGGVRSNFSGSAEGIDLGCDDFEGACRTDFVLGFGGGVDVRLTDRLNFRGQIDFLRVFAEDEETGAENANAVRYMFGISTRLGGS
jgi:hypothetical protein